MASLYVVTLEHRIYGNRVPVAVFGTRKQAEKFCDEKHKNPRVPESHVYIVQRVRSYLEKTK